MLISILCRLHRNTNPPPGIRIEGQAEVDRQRNRRDSSKNSDGSQDLAEFACQESELKEKALRNN